MTVYHGGYEPVDHPEIRIGRNTKDFGPGFYCTVIKEQAERWAKRYATKVVSVYDVRMNGNLIIKEFKQLERKTKNGMIKFKVTNKPKRKSEQPIMLTIEALERKMYSCCKMEAKIKPILKMNGSYCPYCGVMDYGIE